MTILTDIIEFLGRVGQLKDIHSSFLNTRDMEVFNGKLFLCACGKSHKFYNFKTKMLAFGEQGTVLTTCPLNHISFMDKFFYPEEQITNEFDTEMIKNGYDSKYKHYTLIQIQKYWFKVKDFKSLIGLKLEADQKEAQVFENALLDRINNRDI